MKDLIGKRFGRLLVKQLSEVKKYPKQTKAYWVCICDCTNEKIVRGEHLTSGATKSCGCAYKGLNLRHGHSRRGEKSPEYQTFCNMHNRLSSKEPHKVKSYKGISVSESWCLFENFLADMGSKPSPEHSLDRINPFGHYCKENCRWATRSEQMLNTKRHYR